MLEVFYKTKNEYHAYNNETECVCITLQYRKYTRLPVEDRVVDTYRRSRTRMRERTRHRSGNTRSRVANGVTRHRRR